MRYEILVDRTERPQKCTILPLGYRTDFRIVRFDRRSPIASLTGSLLLHPDGAPLGNSTADGLTRPGPIVLSAVDCNWLRLPAVMGRIVGPLPELVRIPDGFQTSYLRRNKRNLDPDNGLAVASVSRSSKSAPKYLQWDEAGEAYRRGHSLLLYQHYPRRPRLQFEQEICARLRAETGAARVDVFSTAHVAFVALSHASHAEQVERAAKALQSRWAGEIQHRVMQP